MDRDAVEVRTRSIIRKTMLDFYHSLPPGSRARIVKIARSTVAPNVTSGEHVALLRRCEKESWNELGEDVAPEAVFVQLYLSRTDFVELFLSSLDEQ